MTTAWHYTIGINFEPILEGGHIVPAEAGVKPPERPIVWFSLNQSFEMTARKGIARANGSVRTATLQETKELGRGLIRFGCDTGLLIPWRGGELRKAAQMTYGVAKKLETAGVKQGASPFEWFGSLDPVPVADCLIEVMSEEGEWVRVQTPLTVSA